MGAASSVTSPRKKNFNLTPSMTDLDAEVLLNAKLSEASHQFNQYGLNLWYLNSLIKDFGGPFAFRGMTVEAACEKFIKPLTAPYELSFVSLLKIQNHYAVGLADVYVSYSRQTDFMLLLDTLTRHFQDEPEVIVWLDMFSNNQNGSSNVPEDWWTETFPAAVAKINRTVVMYDSWSRPSCMTRTWCLFEMFTFIKMKCKVEVAIPWEEIESLLDKVSLDIYCKDKLSFGRIDFEKSHCYHAHVKEHILQLMASQQGGIDEVNEFIFAKVKGWMVAEMHRYASKDNAIPLIRRRHCLYELGKFYRESKEYAKAEETFERLFEADKKLPIDSLDRCISCYTSGLFNLFFLSKDQEKYKQAELLLVDEMARIKPIFGEDGAEMWKLMEAYVRILIYTNREPQAEAMLKKAINAVKEIRGVESKDYIDRMFALSVFYMSADRYEEQEKCLLEIYETCKENSLLLRYCPFYGGVLGELFIEREKYMDAEPLVYEVYNDKVKCKQSFLHDFQNLAKIYLKSHRFQEAEDVYTHWIEHYTSELYEDHPKVLDWWLSLGNYYEMNHMYDKAIPIFERMVQKNTELRGPYHPSTEWAVESLERTNALVVRRNSCFKLPQ